MIKISNIKLPLGCSESDIRQKAAELLGISTDSLENFALARLSVDARKKSEIHYVCAVTLSAENEEALAAAARSRQVSLFTPQEYVFPGLKRKSKLPPVVAGMGPAGLFAALHLARAGLRPVVLERGRSVEARTRDVARFWKTGELDPDSNVQFGEGGAGTFSDGKLSTGTNDPRISHVFSTFVSFGAPEDILWSNRPHVGTDVLRDVVRNIRAELIALGCDIRFESTLCGIAQKDGALYQIAVSSGEGQYDMPCDALVLAPGHSARDTFEMLFRAGLPMAPKAFAIGVRLEHSQRMISQAQYGAFAELLPPADYKLSCRFPNGRSAFSFCVCPGGRVVAAASEPGRLVTNGMSLRARDGENINAGILVGVTPEDFKSKHPLGGLRFQERWEEKAFDLGGGDFFAPVQTTGDFLARRASKKLGTICPSYLPGVKPANLRRSLPAYVSDTLEGAIPAFDGSLRGFADPDSLMTGIETRSSSPVRILRGEDFQTAVRGIYPCGEGAGYAGGITSAAVDGVRVAEALAAGL
ncbi:MAG: hypothetical protein LBL15_08200 [Oscillospiraceae bacterium]|nr:hypothetical protein [Oscillospiraceae bacterium]